MLPLPKRDRIQGLSSTHILTFILLIAISSLALRKWKEQQKVFFLPFLSPLFRGTIMKMKKWQRVNKFPGSGFVTNKVNLATSKIDPRIPRAFKVRTRSSVEKPITRIIESISQIGMAFCMPSYQSKPNYTRVNQLIE